jgi:arylsulfatase A-like enzyme
MSARFNRRDFLRLAGLAPFSLAAPRWARELSAAGARQNVVVVVFDALSAHDISVYGYPRDTTPNLRRLAKRAVVYHSHYAGSNWTTPGTASLLTGTLPWTHRAFGGNGKVADSFVDRNIFAAFDDYHRVTYTHNPWAFTLLDQFAAHIDELIPVRRLCLRFYDSFLYDVFNRDKDISAVSWARSVGIEDDYAYSLFLSHLDGTLREQEYERVKRDYPLGLPQAEKGNHFVLGQAIDWIARRLDVISQPFFGYFHFMPPHAPYRPPAQFASRFLNDGFHAAEKPVDIFADDRLHIPAPIARRQYDEYILHLDDQFGRFYDQLEKSGVLDNTWLILTSDHGEMFERGIITHSSAAFYQPLVRVPLLVWEPGRQQGMDIRVPTSAADLLPTLAHLTGHRIPDWTEGKLLPPYTTGEHDQDRPVFAARSNKNKRDAPLTVASTMLVKGDYKLLYYFGYPELKGAERVQLFDVAADPEEMNELSGVKKDVAAALLQELKAKIAEVNKPYA